MNQKGWKFSLAGAQFDSNSPPDFVQEETGVGVKILGQLKVSGLRNASLTNVLDNGSMIIATKIAQRQGLEDEDEDGGGQLYGDSGAAYFVSIQSHSPPSPGSEEVETTELLESKTEFEDRHISFVPGIHLVPASEASYHSSSAWHEEGKIQLCMPGSMDQPWFVVDADFHKTYDPGTWVSFKNNLITRMADFRFMWQEGKAVLYGLENIGLSGDTWYIDWEDTGEEHDTLWDPLEWKGYEHMSSFAAGSRDYYRAHKSTLGVIGYESFPSLSGCGDDSTIKYHPPGPSGGAWYKMNDYGVVLEEQTVFDTIPCGTSSCKTHWLSRLYLAGSAMNTHFHLQAKYYMATWQDEFTWDGSCLMGLCVGSASCLNFFYEKIADEEIGDEVSRRFYDNSSFFEYHLYDNETHELLPTDGSYEYEFSQKREARYTKGTYTTWQHNDLVRVDNLPAGMGWFMGSRVRGSEYLEKIKQNDAWIIFVNMLREDERRDQTYSPWNMENSGYLHNGFYSNGGWHVWGDESGKIGENESGLVKRDFLVNLLGKEVYLEEGPWLSFYGDAHFYPNEWDSYYFGLDAQIFNFDGIPVYMYSYAKRTTVYFAEGGASVKWEYARYGYFFGDVHHHFQSPKFPCIEGSGPYHYIFDSESQGKVAWGGVAGFKMDFEKQAETGAKHGPWKQVFQRES